MLRNRFLSHRRNLRRHLQRASEFLIKCQIREPYVKKGTLRGAVCPWEIGVMETQGFTLQEDFHDTLEAMWVWTYYSKVSKQPTYISNINIGWKYVKDNFNRFIPSDRENEGYYDCAQLLHMGILYQEVFTDNSFQQLLEIAGTRLRQYLSTLRPARGREFSDPWWMAACLSGASKALQKQEWANAAQNFVNRTILRSKNPFRLIEKERQHRGPGRHDFFSQNATRILALLSCSPTKEVLEDLLLNKFLPVTPTHFVLRSADENAWNASVAASLGKCFVATREPEFLKRYFIIMDELKQRDWQQSAALPREELFPIRESWVTYFYAYAYAAPLSSSPF
jgi:hypothetical protein